MPANRQAAADTNDFKRILQKAYENALKVARKANLSGLTISSKDDQLTISVSAEIEKDPSKRCQMLSDFTVLLAPEPVAMRLWELDGSTLFIISDIQKLAELENIDDLVDQNLARKKERRDWLARISSAPVQTQGGSSQLKLLFHSPSHLQLNSSYGGAHKSTTPLPPNTTVAPSLDNDELAETYNPRNRSK